MLVLLFTAPVGNQRPGYYPAGVRRSSQTPELTCAAAALPDAASPALPVPVRPHGLDLIHRGRSPHAVEALPRSAVRQGAVGARTVRIEAETVLRHDAGRRLGVGAHQVSPVGGGQDEEGWSRTGVQRPALALRPKLHT